jgi:hypothetical protein
MNPTTINPNANFFQQGQGGNPSVINTTAPSTPLDASKLTNQTTVNLKPTTQIPAPDITSLMSSEVPQVVAPTAPQPKQGLGDKLAGLIGLSKGKEADLQGQVQMQTQPYAQQLNELNTQIKMQQAKAIQNQELAMQRGETTGFASREAQAIARTDAIETLKLSALAEGMRGNIALAEQQATQAINAKYADIDRQIEDAKTNIYNNYDSMSPAEKKKADATLLRLDKDDAFVKMRKEDDKITQGFLQEAIAQSAQNGTPIPSLVLQRADQAETPTEALQILAPYMVDADAKAEALLNRRFKLAQISSLEYENELTKAKVNATNTAIANGQLTPEQGKAVNDLTVQLRNEPSYKEMFEIRAGYNTAKVGFEQSNGFGDIAMVNGYQRMIDPGATVRGEDIKTQAEATAYIQKVLNVKGKIFQGDRMTAETRKLLNKAVDEQYSRRVTDFDSSTKARYENVINRNPMLSGSVSFDDIGDSFGSGISGSVPKVNTVNINGQQYQVGKVYTDKTGNWMVDANGKWSKQ